MTTTKTPRDAFMARLQSRIEVNTLNLAEWAHKFAADPLYQLRWADGTFAAAATNKVALEALAILNRPATGERPAVTLAQLRKHVQAQALRGARYPERSTSASANLAHQCETAAYAEMLEWLDEAE